MLPLHSDDQLNNAKKWDLNNLNIPKNGVISGSSNMWKTFFGDGDILLEGIGKLIRKYPFYHHIFIGTERCLDNLEVFLIKNPDLKKNIHFIGPVKNIYRILKSLDLRERGVKIISCPSCARQGFQVIETVKVLEQRLSHIKTPITLSVIGCVVNGPGEAAMTDVGITGGKKGNNMLYLSGVQSEKVLTSEMIEKVVGEVEKKASELENS